MFGFIYFGSELEKYLISHTPAIMSIKYSSYECNLDFTKYIVLPYPNDFNTLLQMSSNYTGQAKVICLYGSAAYKNHNRTLHISKHLRL